MRAARLARTGGEAREARWHRHQPVDGIDEAMAKFRAIWEHAQHYGAEQAKQAPDEA